MSKPKFMVEKLIQVGQLKRYIREIDHKVESGQIGERLIAITAAPSESRLAINYILGRPSNDHY